MGCWVSSWLLSAPLASPLSLSWSADFVELFIETLASTMLGESEDLLGTATHLPPAAQASAGARY